MSFYKKDLKYHWLSEVMEKRLENTCITCRYFSTEYGKRCKFVAIGFSSLCVPVKDSEKWGCVYYKNRENKE